MKRISSTGLRGIGDVLVVGGAAGIDLMVWHGDSTVRNGQVMPWWVVPALTALTYPVLLLRRRHPRAVFALHWVFALAGVPLPDYVPFAGLLVALHGLSRYASTRWAGVGLGLCAVPFGVNAYNVVITLSDQERVLGFVGIMVLWAALVLTVWGNGRLLYLAKCRADREKHEQATAAVRAERLHLAREVHDIVSHSVSAMILQAAGARTLASREDAQVRDALKTIETTGVQAMEELHRLLDLLRTASSDQGDGQILRAASLNDLDALVSSARASGVDVEVVVEGHPADLDHSVGVAAYRIVQEALTNTIKHAGNGSWARVHLRWEPNELILTIRNRAGLQNRKVTDFSSGHGLAGLRERVHLVGGSLEAGPVTDGFLVQAQLPTRPPPPHRDLTTPAHQDAS